MLLLLALPALWVLWHISTLLRNRQHSMKLGVPLVVSPFGLRSVLWSKIYRRLEPLLVRLPTSCGFAVVICNSCIFEGKFKAHEKLGKIFGNLTPTGNEIYVADAFLSNQILLRTKDFVKLVGIMEPLNLFGKSLASVEGADWQRHRKVTAPAFHAENNVVVWEVSLLQAGQMLRALEMQGVESLGSEIRTLALHILTETGLGRPSDFSIADQSPNADPVLVYQDSLAAVLDNLLLILGTRRLVQSLPWLPKIWLPKIWLPNKLLRIQALVADFKKHMAAMVEEELLSLAHSTHAHSNLLTALLNKSSRVSMTEDEIYGNIFIFSLAGHESAANTLHYALHLFSAYPEWQDWAGEEVDHLLQGRKDEEPLIYEDLYPQLKRCKAIMLETLRLYGPVLGIPKRTGPIPQRLKVDGRDITVPPHTNIYCNSVALHTYHKYWGSDSILWLPSRWIVRAHTAESTPADVSPIPPFRTDELYKPIQGSYIPWADGAQNCLGKAFSQVEFVAVMIILLSKYRVHALPEAGETIEQVRKRAYETVEDRILKLTLQMRNPGSVRLRLVRR